MIRAGKVAIAVNSIVSMSMIAQATVLALDQINAAAGLDGRYNDFCTVDHYAIAVLYSLSLFRGVPVPLLTVTCIRLVRPAVASLAVDGVMISKSVYPV